MAEFKEKRNEKGEYLTIAEFAERAGVSKQAVYQRLNKGLKEYSRCENVGFTGIRGAVW